MDVQFQDEMVRGVDRRRTSVDPGEVEAVADRSGLLTSEEDVAACFAERPGLQMSPRRFRSLAGGVHDFAASWLTHRSPERPGSH
mmetsp:Transcript_46178/g.108125  ORF Transcript_46178/g.108125 Transcript_46178/m.108125 type:complete len:85 (-) Transcript_46178:79-333(-)